MSDQDDRVADKLDRLMEHVLDLKTAVARMEGANLLERVSELEAKSEANVNRWAKFGVAAGAAAFLATEVAHVVMKKMGWL